MEGKSRARAETDPAGGFRVTAHQHGHRTPAQRPSGAILHGGRIAYAADRPSHPRAMAGRRAAYLAHRSVVAAPSRSWHAQGARGERSRRRQTISVASLVSTQRLPRKHQSNLIRDPASQIYAPTKPVSLLLRVLIGMDSCVKTCARIARLTPKRAHSPRQRPPQERAKLRLNPSSTLLSLPGYLSRPCTGRRGADSRCFE